ncbi:hypothetical protein EI94DRAFT_1797821 [Lactarius quietus]|nr:hypothetical protein EI94DRAFT_1797821 [Lactarius quietus]
MLEKKYGADHNGTYSYIDTITATAIPLTPFMMKEWAHAMYDGAATMNNPPNTVTFDHTVCKDLGFVSCHLAVLVGCFFMRPDHALPLPSMPGPKHHNKLASPVVNASSAVFNTPSKLERFLRVAERNGILGVVTFHPMLLEKGYGLDIMHLINVTDLVDIGMLPSDAICLKEYAHPHDETVHHNAIMLTQALPPASESTPPSKRLRFEKHFNDGGGNTVYGPAVRSGSWGEVDYTWWIYSKELSMYVPLPSNKVPYLKNTEFSQIITIFCP